MTTESKPSTARPTDTWTLAEHRAERARNRAWWDAHQAALLERFPDHWIVIHGGPDGCCVVAETDGEALLQRLLQLDDFTRGAMHWAWPPLRSPRAAVGYSISPANDPQS